MKKFIICIFILSTSILATAQYVDNYEIASPVTIVKFGVGVGIDYGGIGGRFTITPVPKLGIFAAVGYNLNKTGFNGGLTYKFSPDKKVTPVIGVMYGYNSVIVIDGASKYNKTYYGPSVSGGIELNMKKSKNYWSFELVVPFRSSEFENDWSAIKNNPDFEVDTEPLPVMISVGYHFNV